MKNWLAGWPASETLWGSLASCGRLSIGPLPLSQRTGGGNQPPRRLATCPTSMAPAVFLQGEYQGGFSPLSFFLKPHSTLSSWEMRFFLIALSLVGVSLAQPPRCTEKTANDWYAKQPWLVGSNFLPATAINQLEMWGTEPLDPNWIDNELTRAEVLGMNTMRVFLHDLPWKSDEGAFEHRIDRFHGRSCRNTRMV